MDTFIQWKRKKKKSKRFLIQIALAFTFFLVVFEAYQRIIIGSFNWPALNVLLIVYALVFFNEKNPYFKKNVLEKYSETKWIGSIRFVFFIIVALPISIYTLKIVYPSGSNDQRLEITLISVMTSLVGFIVSLLGSKIALSEKTRLELISSTQKFALAVVLFLVFIPSIQLTDLLGGIDINSLAFDSVSLGRGLYFWFSATCFYSAVFLFTMALVDFSLALRGLKQTTG